MSDSLLKLGALGQGQLSQAQIESQIQKVEKLRSQSTLDPSASKGESREEAEKAARDFEAIMVKQMFSAMWATVPKGGLLSGSREEEHYQEMLQDSLAKEFAKGEGMGIRDVIMRELLKKNAYKSESES